MKKVIAAAALLLVIFCNTSTGCRQKDAGNMNVKPQQEDAPVDGILVQFGGTEPASFNP